MAERPPTKRRKKRKRRACAPARRRKPVEAKSARAEQALLAKARRRKKRKPICKPKKKPPLPATGTHPIAVLPAIAEGTGPAPAVPDPPQPTSTVPGDVTPTPGSDPEPPGRLIESPIAVYAGPFGARQAERLLWRAGFGPRPGDAERVAAMGMERAVLALTRPSGSAVLEGPEPTVNGAPLSPYESWYGHVLYWLDRMVRSSHQLVERLALVFHDWWATSNDTVGSNRLMLEQTNLFRTHGLGSFRDMVVAVTRDPAMLVFLDGITNRKGKINENYAREVMELFTLGADRGAYTERDVRELARALTGWNVITGMQFVWDSSLWDAGNKTVFGQSGPFTWEDACRLVVDHPMHASFFVRKLWSYFVPVPPSDDVAARLEQHYVATGHQVRPIVEAILCSPEFHAGPRMVKPPAVLCAGLLRARGLGIDSDHWAWQCSNAGQRPYHPPDVSGWDDANWLDTNTVRGRWELVYSALEGATSDPGQPYPEESADEAVARARAFWLDPWLSDEAIATLHAFARDGVPAPPEASARAQRQNALRQLVPATPDYQTC